MEKVDINNEMILLRQPVRQARVCVINKLIREAKKLRTKQGNEKQQEKNKKKSDKLLKEVYTLKLIKDDEISKFGIINADNLQDILQNPSTSDKKRIMAKVARFKPLSMCVLKFKQKCPDYESYFTSERKERASNKQKFQATKGSSKRNNGEARARATNANLSDNVDADITKDNEKSEPHCEMHLRSRDRISQAKRQNSEKSSAKSNNDEIDKRPERDKKKSKKIRDISDMDTSPDSEKTTSFKVIGKEATVKRFVDILQEENKADVDMHPETSKVETSEETMMVEREVDDFFISANGENPHSSIKVLRPKLRESQTGHCTETSRDISNIRLGKRGQKIVGGIEAVQNRGIKSKDSRRPSDIHNRSAIIDDSRQKRQKVLNRPEKVQAVANPSNTNGMENESLHPSWAAKKKQQEVLKQGFQGKKIVFDDD